MSNPLAVLLAGIPALLNLSILVYLVFFVTRNKITSLFALLVFSLSLWQVEDILLRVLSHEESVQFWDSMLSLGWLSTAPLLLHFSLRFTGSIKPQSRTLLLVVYILFLIFYTLYVSFAEPVPFTYHQFWGWQAQIRPGTADNLQRYFIPLVAALALFILFRNVFRHRHDKKKMYQGLLIGTGLLITAVQGTVTQLIFPVTTGQEVPLTSSSMVLFSIGTLIALKRYNLFDLRDSLDVKEVLNNLQQMVIAVAPDGRVLYLNPFASRILGIPHTYDHIHLKTWFPAGDPEWTKFKKLVLEASTEGKSISNYELVLRQNNGRKRHLLLTADRIMGRKKVLGILLVANDITQRKKFVAALADQHRRMREISWTQAHVVRAPLARILGLVNILDNAENASGDQKDLLNHLAAAAQELDEVIHEIVKKSNPERGEE